MAMQAPGTTGEDVGEEEVTVRSAAFPVAVSLLVVLMMSVDWLNPVKVFLAYMNYFDVLPSEVTENQIALIAFFLFLSICVTQRTRLIYNMTRLFFRCTFNNMFFRSVEVVGMENIPNEGPLILTGNHNNQFVDGLIMLTNTTREISFMIAQKSWDRPLIGFLARAFHCIPVARAQDMAIAGEGKVVADGTTCLRGEGTRFTAQVTAGAQLEVVGQEKALKVVEVVSDTELTLKDAAEASGEGTRYKILPKMDQSAMYSRVFEKLGKGKCLGIFPEGGSHDRTDLLPLKAGVAIIALEAITHHNIAVPIVPVGLNYFQGHRFGGRVVVEFGAPIIVPEELCTRYETDKRGATDELLQTIAAGMRSVIVPVPDYKTLQKVYMMRRLWMPDTVKLSPLEVMDINRRFAVGAQRILKYKENIAMHASLQEVGALPSPSELNAHGISDEDFARMDLCERNVERYMEDLKRLGLRDHQVRRIHYWSFGDIVARLMYLLVAMALGIIPQVLFNLPIILLASRAAAIEQKKSLKASSVKLAARDVLMSYKVIYVLMCVPLMYLLYGGLLFAFSPWCITTKVLFLIACPLFAFLGMKASEQGVREWKNILPEIKRIYHGPTRIEQDAMPRRRAELQKEVQRNVRKMGPMLGELYRSKTVDWSKEMNPLRASPSTDDFARARAASPSMEEAATRTDSRTSSPAEVAQRTSD